MRQQSIRPNSSALPARLPLRRQPADDRPGHHLLDHSLTHASIDPWRREHTDHGDCVLVLLDPHTPKNRLLHPLVPKLAAALARHNRAPQPRSACTDRASAGLSPLSALAGAVRQVA